MTAYCILTPAASRVRPEPAGAASEPGTPPRVRGGTVLHCTEVTHCFEKRHSTTTRREAPMATSHAECSTPPRTTSVSSQNGRVPPPLKPHAPSSPHLLSTMRAAAHTRHSGNAAHAERGPTCMCVRRAPSRARPCVAPPGSACSRRLCPAVRWRPSPSSRAGQPR